MRITVIGLGYLGVTHAACMAELGFEVLGLDSDAERVAMLSAGSLPFYEPGLSELVSTHTATGRLRFTTSYADIAEFGAAASDGVVHFLCVGTPQQAHSEDADLSSLFSAVERLTPHLVGRCVVVGKSTVPVGTAADVVELLAAHAPAGADPELIWNPEFLREGNAVRDTLRPDRIVFGVRERPGREPESEGLRLLRRVYAEVIAAGVPVVVTDYATAELVKVSANAFLSTKISFLNAVAEVCEVTGADVKQLAEALAHDRRIGGGYLSPGIGFGGGCLPKDLRAFAATAEKLGLESLGFLRSIDAINLATRRRAVSLTVEACGGDVADKRIAVWGAAFKPDSDDIRDSPALWIAAALHDVGATVVVYDPQAMDKARKAHPQLSYADSATDAAVGAHAIVHLTEWDEFRHVSPRALSEVVHARNIVDGRNVLDARDWCAHGWTYRALGRPVVSAT
ncbi:UDP-glucose dehydrogenase family protein [Saccharomonospora glauca]|jgi:UDPglucose 6-dehydrogenase|uniref:UDP-glucose 6-dehydrogenase n=1 Tax=Saccharomonospora glauca K62 TaxID=928724 RepID=I1CYQ1_9PSEU|nr:UDP-glucose/GDP-mannose dehydrogenase family protein [Saccharomonospora glauca]EIE97825.1 nucleotide sugar dehydrogenase [Saccharomonospora glauca K62]